MEKKKKKEKEGGKDDLRSKYKKNPVKIADLKNAKKEEDAALGYTGAGDYLEINEGANKFRLFPPHDGTDFMVMRKVYWVDIPDDEGTPKRRTVPCSIVHGGTKKDIFEEYIKFIQKHCKDKTILDKITAYQVGLQASFTWAAYAIKLEKDKREFGLVEFKKSVRDQLNKNMFTEDDDDPIEVDPYTDPDDGQAFIVNYNSKPNKKKGEDWYTVVVKKSVALTEEELEKFDASPSLQSLYRNTYKMRDFDRAIEALTYYDEVNGIDMFDDDRWLEIIKDVKSQYEADEENSDKKEKKKSKKEEKQPEKAPKKDKEALKGEKKKEKGEKKPEKADKEEKSSKTEKKQEKPAKEEKKSKDKTEKSDEKPPLTLEDIKANLAKKNKK